MDSRICARRSAAARWRSSYWSSHGAGPGVLGVEFRGARAVHTGFRSSRGRIRRSAHPRCHTRGRAGRRQEFPVRPACDSPQFATGDRNIAPSAPSTPASSPFAPPSRPPRKSVGGVGRRSTAPTDTADVSTLTAMAASRGRRVIHSSSPSIARVDQALSCAGLPKTNGLTASQNPINTAWLHRRVHIGTSTQRCARPARPRTPRIGVPRKDCAPNRCGRHAPNGAWPAGTAGSRGCFDR